MTFIADRQYEGEGKTRLCLSPHWRLFLHFLSFQQIEEGIETHLYPSKSLKTQMSLPLPTFSLQVLCIRDTGKMNGGNSTWADLGDFRGWDLWRQLVLARCGLGQGTTIHSSSSSLSGIFECIFINPSDLSDGTETDSEHGKYRNLHLNICLLWNVLPGYIPYKQLRQEPVSGSASHCWPSFITSITEENLSKYD